MTFRFTWLLYSLFFDCSSYTRDCSGDNSCDAITIDCAAGEDCDIQCLGIESCENALIKAAPGYKLGITCDNEISCRSLTIDADSATQFDLYGCTHVDACVGQNIYCPENVSGEKKCTLRGDDSFGSVSSYHMRIWTINGWNDVNISAISTISNIGGKLYCQSGYTKNCDIDEATWSCTNSSVCDHDPTTSIPTKIPTKGPITVIPTNYPSNIPSNIPSKTPSYMPSEIPTNYPVTNIPSNIPTLNPTTPIQTTSSPITNNPSLVVPSKLPTLNLMTPTSTTFYTETNYPSDVPSDRLSTMHMTNELTFNSMTETMVDITKNVAPIKQSQDNSNTELILLIVGGALVGLFMILFIIILLSNRYRKSKKMKLNNINNVVSEMQIQPHPLQHHIIDELEINGNDFDEEIDEEEMEKMYQHDAYDDIQTKGETSTGIDDKHDLDPPSHDHTRGDSDDKLHHTGGDI